LLDAPFSILVTYLFCFPQALTSDGFNIAYKVFIT
jgi:hypothetical protein